MSTHLKDSLSDRSVHLCIDMQRLFAPGGPWPAPWMDRIVSQVGELASWRPDRTIFTRFITPYEPGDAHGEWRRYYVHWRSVTRSQIDPELLQLIPSLERLVPPATTVEKAVYSPFVGTRLPQLLKGMGCDALIISGGESDVCVLAAVLDSVDLGYRVIVASDAIWSSSDNGHDAFMVIMRNRFSQQVETATTETILQAWSGPS